MRYFVGFLIVLGLLIIGVILMFRLLLGGGEKTQPEYKSELVNYAGTTTTMELTVDQPINADQVHRQVKISVGSSQTTVRLLTGYEGVAVKTETYANNPSSYASFLRALDAAGYTKGDKNSELKDERGFCPRGKRYVFEIQDGSETLQRYWSTSCNDNSNFNGRSDVILRLFKAQIPDYRKVTKGLKGYNF